jgi:ribonuclease R
LPKPKNLKPHKHKRSSKSSDLRFGKSLKPRDKFQQRNEISRVVGIFRKDSGSGSRIIPSGKKERGDYHVSKGQENGARDGELVSAELLRTRGRSMPEARVLERLGDASDPRNISLIAIHTHGIPNVFPDSVLDETAKLKNFDKAGREDLRHIPLITIDPFDARDHDDAIWAEADTAANNPGGHLLVISIADVSAYVRPGTALDREAIKRGNSVYFPDRVVPMLPERISNDLCSLKEGEDRPALACFVTVDAKGHKLNHRFVRAIIRVAAGLSYEEAQAAINGKPTPRASEVLRSTLQPLWKAYAALKDAIASRQPLDLDLPERKILLDDKGNIKQVVVPERLDAHRLVEAFMIEANVAAAEILVKKRTPLLFRVHENPSAEKIKSLADFLKTVNIPLSLGQVIRSRHFNRILAQAKDTPHERVVHEVVLRSQAQANYRTANEGHFGLSLANYAHFTSPIRRYADVIVHRALISALKLGDDGLSAADMANMDDVGESISASERRAMIAERETVDRLVASHLAAHLGATFEGRISGVVGAGLFVNLKDTGADGFVPVSKLGLGHFVYDVTSHSLTGAGTGERFQLGDTVTVRLMEATPVKGGLRFDILSGGKAADWPTKTRGFRPKHKGRKH